MHVWSESGYGPVHLAGSLDVRYVAHVREVLDRALADGCGDLVVDMSEVELVDATGLGVLVAAHRKASRRGRRLVLRGVRPALLRLLAVTRLHRILYVERLVAV